MVAIRIVTTPRFAVERTDEPELVVVWVVDEELLDEEPQPVRPTERATSKPMPGKR
jgi:hypothetical protein